MMMAGQCIPHCRHRKVHSAPFPPGAKTAPAPLLLHSPPREARRRLRIVLGKKSTGRERSKRKNPFWSQLRTYVQSCCTGGGVRSCLRVCADRPTGAAGHVFGRGDKTHSICFCLRAFRFTRKGYAASVRRQSRQRLRSCYALAEFHAAERRRMPSGCALAGQLQKGVKGPQLLYPDLWKSGAAQFPFSHQRRTCQAKRKPQARQYLVSSMGNQGRMKRPQLGQRR